jgi:hypothetical protein
MNVFTFSMGVPSHSKWALTCKSLVIDVTIEWPFTWDVKVSQLLVTWLLDVLILSSNYDDLLTSTFR